MSARIAKEEMALLLPNSLSNYTSYDANTAVRPANGFVQKLADALRWMVEMPRRRAVIGELSMLSDHELADIGLSRSELSHVFDSAFINKRNTLRSSHGRRTHFSD